MTILPALMLVDGDLDGIAEFTFCDLDASVLAWLGMATSAVVRRLFCYAISFDWGRKSCASWNANSKIK